MKERKDVSNHDNIMALTQWWWPTEDVFVEHDSALDRGLHEVMVDGGHRGVHHEGDQEEEHRKGADAWHTTWSPPEVSDFSEWVDPGVENSTLFSFFFNPSLTNNGSREGHVEFKFFQAIIARTFCFFNIFILRHFFNDSTFRCVIIICKITSYPIRHQHNNVLYRSCGKILFSWNLRFKFWFQTLMSGFTTYLQAIKLFLKSKKVFFSGK